MRALYKKVFCMAMVSGLLTALLAGCTVTQERSSVAGQPVPGLTFKGVTRFNSLPLAAGEVMAMRAEPGGRIFRTSIRDDGSFMFVLPQGRYFLMARSGSRTSGKELFSFWANNPLQLFGDIEVPVTLPFVEITAPPETFEGAGITGRVLHEGEPVKGAIVAAFLDASGDFHGQAFAQSAATGDSGEYSLPVPAGRYFLLARRKQVGGMFQGPLLKGDLAGFYHLNPVTLRTGKGMRVDIPTVTVNRPRGTGSLSPGESMLVAGQVTTGTGEPAPGVRVVLYSIPEMLGRPAFISSPADSEGNYRLEVSRTGKFYVAARSVIGRPPETGELMGFYQGSPDHSLSLNWGDRLDGIDVTVQEAW